MLHLHFSTTGMPHNIIYKDGREPMCLLLFVQMYLCCRLTQLKDWMITCGNAPIQTPCPTFPHHWEVY